MGVSAVVYWHTVVVHKYTHVSPSYIPYTDCRAPTDVHPCREPPDVPISTPPRSHPHPRTLTR
jgi:hypothetical protein